MMNNSLVSSSSVSSSQSSSSSSFFSLVQNHTFTSKFQFSSPLIANYPHNNQLLQCPQLHLSSRSHSYSPRPILCRASPGSSGENESKTVLDAFFLGKALGEAITERIESTVGEVLSTIGRLQAEQQKQVQEFQEDVFERAKRAKEKAARETLEEQGRLIPNSSTSNAAETNGASSSAMASRTSPMTAAAPSRVTNPDNPTSGRDEDRVDSDSLSSISIDE